MTGKTQCQTSKSTPTYDYPEAVKAAERQKEIGWLPTEPKVEKDLHCIKTDMSEAAVHGVMTTLKLFTLYEIVAGSEYWNGRFARMFPRPDFRRMAASFGDTELNVHGPFYQRIDELLGLNTDEFYTSFTDDPVLARRMAFLDDVISGEDDLTSVGVFSMVEGAILYSSFAFLMSFQANGQNKLANMHAGLTFSVKDENLHSEGGAWAFRTLLRERQEAGLPISPTLISDLREAAKNILEHETAIIEKIFTLGEIPGVTAKDLVGFVKHRLNVCLTNLGLDRLYDNDENSISEWFYNMIGGDAQHDFFVKMGSAYNRDWVKTDFEWQVGGLEGVDYESV